MRLVETKVLHSCVMDGVDTIRSAGRVPSAPRLVPDTGRRAAFFASQVRRPRGPGDERDAAVPRRGTALGAARVTHASPPRARGRAHRRRFPTWDGARRGSCHPVGAPAGRGPSAPWPVPEAGWRAVWHASPGLCPRGPRTKHTAAVARCETSTVLLESSGQRPRPKAPRPLPNVGRCESWLE